MLTYLVFSAGGSICVIAMLAILGWAAGVPALTTWTAGTMPMAPLTAVVAFGIGASLVLCAREATWSRRGIAALALNAITLAVSALVLVFRATGRHPWWERLGVADAGTLNGAPIGFMSPVTAACFSAAAVAFIAQALPGVYRQARLTAALTTAVAILATGLACLLTTLMRYPMLLASGRIPMAASTSVAMLVLGTGLGAMGIRRSDQLSRHAASRNPSWRPLGGAFVVVLALTVAAGYAFYRQEELELRTEFDRRLEGILVMPTAEAEALAAANRASSALVYTRRLPSGDVSLWAALDAGDLSAELWARLRWVMTFAALLLFSAGAMLALVWRNQRAAYYRQRADLAEARRHQALRVTELVAVSPAVLYTLKRQGEVLVPTDISANVERILGYTVTEALGEDWFTERVFAEDLQTAMAAAAALATTSEVVNEFRFVRKDRSVLWIRNQMAVTRREAGAVVEVAGAWHDITEWHKAETALRESEERLRLALAAAQQGLWDLNVQTGETLISEEYATMLGYDIRDFRETHATWIARLHPDDRDVAVRSFREYLDGRVDHYRVECRQQMRSGEWKWILSRGSLIARSPDGRPLRMLGIHTDVHARKVAELRSEALLKEVHHRVKNNLQVISSLLRLERERHVDVTVKSAMDEMQLRILSMALLHESLYRSTDLARVDLAEYLADLAGQVFRSAAPPTGAIALNLQLASVWVDIDHAVPCGLLVNEMLTNCLKHAFPNGRTGTVSIELRPVVGGPEYLLRISDTGIGLPADFESRQSSSLGVHLIRVLAKQLKTTLRVESQPGATFSMVFVPGTLSSGGTPS